MLNPRFSLLWLPHKIWNSGKVAMLGKNRYFPFLFWGSRIGSFGMEETNCKVEIHAMNIFEHFWTNLIHVFDSCLSVGALSFENHENPRFDHYDLDRLCREGDPELQEELWGSDMEALYRKNDELIDQLGIADLRDMEAHYRLVQRHGMRITCKSCCSSLGPGCLIWDLTGHLRVIGHYWNFLRQNGKAAAHSSLKRLKKVSRVNDPTHSALSDEFWQVHLY